MGNLQRMMQVKALGKNWGAKIFKLDVILTVKQVFVTTDNIMNDNVFFQKIYSKYTKGNNEAQKFRIWRQQDNCKWKS
jgi:hypothetical protein